jgi:arginyl-tRNA synthetase
MPTPPPARRWIVQVTVKEKVRARIEGALDTLLKAGTLVLEGDRPEAGIEHPKSAEHGDFATNVAMVLARPARQPPRKIAEALVEALEANEADPLLVSAEVAGPGFINLRVRPAVWFGALDEVVREGADFGRSDVGARRPVNVEYISANPTGPLHVGHGRGAVTGDVCAALLDWAGFDVTREYYVNDFGNQVEILATSVHTRYRQIFGEDVALPEDAYPGEYVIEAAKALRDRDGERWREAPETEWRPAIRAFAIEAMLDLIRADLGAFNIHFDRFVSERALHEAGRVEKTLEVLRKKGLLYEAEEGGTLFRSTDFGDDKDRAVVKKDGGFTYLAGDIAYHLDKMERGYQRLVNVWGADHAGYIPRMKAAVMALGGAADLLDVRTVQIVHLTRGGQPVRMGKRSGEFVTLREVIDEVGRDATRLLFIMRRSDAQLEFDLELAKRQSLDNPVYYVQYGHARIRAILRRARKEGHPLPEGVPAPEALEALGLPEEIDLARRILAFPELVAGAAEALEPHRVVFYLQETIAAFHGYYTRYKQTDRVLSDDARKTSGRLFLMQALGQVLHNGLTLLGVDAPERMERPEEGEGEGEGEET